MSLFRLAGWLVVVAPLAACTTNSTLDVSGTIADGGGDGDGMVVSDPPGIECTIAAGAATGTCSASFDPHTVVTLTATPSGTSSFDGWENLASGNDFDYEQTLGFQNEALLPTNPLPLDVDEDRALAVLSTFVQTN
jgi:hypothetical protein